MTTKRQREVIRRLVAQAAPPPPRTLGIAEAIFDPVLRNRAAPKSGRVHPIDTNAMNDAFTSDVKPFRPRKRR